MQNEKQDDYACSNCRRDFNEGDDFCPHCGAIFAEEVFCDKHPIKERPESALFAVSLAAMNAGTRCGNLAQRSSCFFVTTIANTKFLRGWSRCLLRVM